MTRIEPGMPQAVIRDSDMVTLESDGRLHIIPNITVPPEVFDQYREGYRCLRCQGVQEEAFPERCIEGARFNACAVPGGYEMRRLQSEDLANEFKGEDVLWPDMPEDEERAAWKPRGQSGIWVPGRNGS